MKADVYVPNGVPIIRGTNISSTRELIGDWVYVPEAFVDAMPRCVVRDGDLVFPHRGSIGEVALVPGDRDRYFLSTSCMKITLNGQKADPRYVAYYFKSGSGRAEIMRFASQVGTPGIGQPLTSLRQFRVPAPPIYVQRAIANLLSSLDDKIELNRRIAETLEGIARAVFKSWFVDFDPVHAKMEGRPTGLSDGLATLFPDRFGEDALPEGWQLSNIAAEFNLTMGQSPPGSSYNETGIGIPLYQGRTDFGFRFPTRRVFTTVSTRMAAKGDTLVSVRAPVGALNMASEPCCVGRGVAALRHKSGSSSYTYYALQSVQPSIAAFEDDGTVFGAINKDAFGRLPVLRPKVIAISAFDEITSAIDERIAELFDEIDTTATLRDALLPKLISGELRITDAEKRVSAA